MLQKDKEGSKKAIAKFRHADDPEVLEASWQIGIDVIERILNLGPEIFKLVLEERPKPAPKPKNINPSSFSMTVQ
jgi:hypothetical protein